MSRAGYSDDNDDILELGRWRGQVTSAIRGKRGQAFLRRLIEALDAMEDKALYAVDGDDGLFAEYDVCKPCAMGALALHSRMEDPLNIDGTDHEHTAGKFNIAHQLMREVEFENDECGAGAYERNPDWREGMPNYLRWRWRSEAPEDRWRRMRDWCVRNLVEVKP